MDALTNFEDEDEYERKDQESDFKRFKWSKIELWTFPINNFDTLKSLQKNIENILKFARPFEEVRIFINIIEKLPFSWHRIVFNNKRLRIFNIKSILSTIEYILLYSSVFLLIKSEY